MLTLEALNKLKWRCRRGLLENDLFVQRFFTRHESNLTLTQADAMAALMNLADNDLLDLFLRRTEPQGELNRPEVHQLLALIRTH
jgi:antitoxin CptB